VRTPPATILPIRSDRLSGAPAATAELRGKNDWPKHTAARAAVAAQIGEVGNIDKPHAEINHVISPTANATGHERERQVHAYAKLNASDARIAERESVAARAPKPGPCERTRMNRIGPATTGKPANQPAIDGPHHLPDIDTTSKNNGTSVSLSASMPKSSGFKVRSYPRPITGRHCAAARLLCGHRDEGPFAAVQSPIATRSLRGRSRAVIRLPVVNVVGR
jgi:hypothetical protein